MRAARRHEQLSVRMALAATQQHSAPKCAGPETHEAPRGHTTDMAAGKRPAALSRSVTFLPPGRWAVLLASKVMTASMAVLLKANSALQKKEEASAAEAARRRRERSTRQKVP